MTDDITRLGNEAEYILTTDAIRIAFDRLDKGVIESWAHGSYQTVEAREEAFRRVRAAREFRDNLIRLVEDMKVSKANADRRAKMRANAGLPEE